jgi:hypothetical protein
MYVDRVRQQFRRCDQKTKRKSSQVNACMSSQAFGSLLAGVIVDDGKAGIIRRVRLESRLGRWEAPGDQFPRRLTRERDSFDFPRVFAALLVMVDGLFALLRPTEPSRTSAMANGALGAAVSYDPLKV